MHCCGPVPEASAIAARKAMRVAKAGGGGGGGNGCPPPLVHRGMLFAHCVGVDRGMLFTLCRGVGVQLRSIM